MYKLDFSQNVINSNKELTNKVRLKQPKQISFQDNKSREYKQNDSKHLNAIKPYVVKERKNSKRQIRPTCSEISRSKSKKLQTSNRKIEQNSMISCQNILTTNQSQKINCKQINQIHQELIILKTEYKTLKVSYNTLIKQKEQISFQEQTQKQKNQRQKLILHQNLQKSKKNAIFLESEIERIKKQCFKIVQSEKFKNKKLQETIQQKQLMISFLRTENDYLKKSKDLNASQHQNLEKIFFLQNSAPIFSYESYARLSANTSMISAINNVLIEEDSAPNGLKDKKFSMRHKKSQFQEDSLSFSRNRSKQFDSVHSLLSNNDQTIMTFTKKDIIVLDDSLSLDSKKEKSSSGQSNNCLTFENRKQEGKPIISFENLKSKKMLYKSESQAEGKKVKNSNQHTKRLQILTDEFKGVQKQKQDENSCETKKKFSKSKARNMKKNSKNQGLHNSMINQVLHAVRKDTSKYSNSKRR